MVSDEYAFEISSMLKIEEVVDEAPPDDEEDEGLSGNADGSSTAAARAEKMSFVLFIVVSHCTK